MAQYQILSWYEFPAQVKAKEDGQKVSVQLPPRFEQMIDLAATKRGLVGSDAYLEGWQWSEQQQRDGSPQEVAEAVARELEEKFPETS